MNKRLKLRIVLILFILSLLVIIPVYAQDTTAEPTATVEVTAPATAEATTAAAAPTVEATSAATIEAAATTEATVEATEAATVEAGVLPTEVPPETRPVAGVADANNEQLSSSGVVTLVLLVGLVAIGAVAFSSVMRGSLRPPKE